MAPIFRRMAVHPNLDLQVAYCSLRGAELGFDPEFQTSIEWDVPLLEGYSLVEVANRGSGQENFWGLNNSGLAEIIRRDNFDAVLCFVSYLRASIWIVQRAAKVSGTAFLFGTDAHSLAPRDAATWKIWLKRLFWPFLFRQADQVIVPSTGTFELISSLGIPVERITLTPYSVDNDWWKSASAKVNRPAVRAEWGVTSQQPVILFCGKLQPWKRPMDLLRAFADANISDSLLFFAGDGPLRPELELEAARLGLQLRVRFLGFVNQSLLPTLYTSADVLVLPSSYEPFAVVVNEAMCCRCPAIVSDQVGAARDLVMPVEPRFVFPAGDIGAIANTLQLAFANPEQLRKTVDRGFAHVETHSPARVIAATVDAVRQAVARIHPDS